ncbi:hypothetical protein ACS0TY_031589 [Phlomoides rotata]
MRRQNRRIVEIGEEVSSDSTVDKLKKDGGKKCTKDMGPNLKKPKTGVFNHTRSNTNSPSSRPTPLAGASCTSSRLGDIPPTDTSENPSTTPTAAVEQDPPTTNPPTTTDDGVEQDAGLILRVSRKEKLVLEGKRALTRMLRERSAGIYGSGELCLNGFPLTQNGKVKTSTDAKESEVGGGKTDESDIQEFKDILLSMGREAAEFSNKYTSKLTNLIEKTRASKENVGGTSYTPTPEMSDSQSFFMDETLHKYVDDLQANFVVTQKLINAILTCELLSPDPPVRDEAYYDIGANTDLGVDVSE